MKVEGKSYRSIWYDENTQAVKIIDQRWLPHEFRIATLDSLQDFAIAITDMWVRGAPLIGATAAFGVAMEMRRGTSDAALERCRDTLLDTRPTAINLRWALDRCLNSLRPLPVEQRASHSLELARQISDEDVEINRRIGVNGLEIIKKIADTKKENEPVNILTHCNAGWIATVDWGTATSPMYQAHDLNIPIHIWVDETRPRNQGALTSWELGSHGISHQYIVDNAGGYLMQKGHVDLVIVGTDRTSAGGDVCNKIGTYLKALAARDNGIPFYVALPSPTIDWTITDGLTEIPIEERLENEVTHVMGKGAGGELEQVQVSPAGTKGGNPAFDVTPRHLVTGLITELGICEASPKGLATLFPEKARENSK